MTDDSAGKSRGRSPMRWTDQVKLAITNPMSDCTRQSRNRERWREIAKKTVSASNTNTAASM